MGDAGAMPKQVNDLSNAAKVLQANLKRWRKARKMTLKQLAERTGYAVSTLSGWENGDREVGTEDLMRLASEYGVHPAALLIAPEGSGPKVDRMIAASGLAEQLTDDQAAHWLAIARSMIGKEPA